MSKARGSRLTCKLQYIHPSNSFQLPELPAMLVHEKSVLAGTVPHLSLLLSDRSCCL